MSGLETIGLVAGLVGTAVSAGGTILSGIAASDAADIEAQQRNAQANEVEAASQREVIQRRREGRLVQSRQQALAAASGGGATDPGVLRLMADTGDAAKYNAASALYEGQTRGDTYRYAGQMAQWKGKQDKISSFVSAGSTVLNGLSSFALSASGGGQLPGLSKKKPLKMYEYGQPLKINQYG